MPGGAALVAEIEARLLPVEVALAEAWWETSTRASPEADARRATLDLERRALLADAHAFAAIRATRAGGERDPLVQRQLDILHDAFLPHQVAEDLRRRLVETEVALESTFNTFRGEVDGERVDDNRILSVLRASDDAGERREVWEASKQVGAEVADGVCALARLRNEAAHSLGYRDHFALALATGELDERRLFATLDDVDARTRAPFAEWKAVLDDGLAARFDCSPGDLRPWHYDDPFFQDPPARGIVDLDPVFAGCDVEALTLRTYDGLGLDLRAVLAASDLYAREGKSQHAFCLDVDREGDVRVLANVEANERWMDTMLHEFGHAAYDRDVDRSLPWLLRGPAHPLTTESVAMLFGRLARDPEWLRVVAGVPAARAQELESDLAAAQRANLLVFARWVLVMTHFERGLYADPDADHEAKWWDLVERFQRLRRPEPPDGRVAWASKIHLTVAPVYYQNYLYGELLASQLAATLDKRYGGLVDRPAAGRDLVDAVFRGGASTRWDRLVERATGRPLSADAFARQLAA